MSGDAPQKDINIRAVVLGIGIVIVCAIVGSWAAVLNLKHTSDVTDKNRTSLVKVQKAAAAALTVAESQRQTILAVCVRFNSDEQISEDQTSNLLAVERQFTAPSVPITERRYHMARLAVLLSTQKIRQTKIKVDCNKAMAAHIASAGSPPARSLTPAP